MKSTTEEILESVTERLLNASPEEQTKAAQDALNALEIEMAGYEPMKYTCVMGGVADYLHQEVVKEKEVHQKIMAKLEKMTPSEILQHAKDLGIYDQDGDLTEHYRSEDETYWYNKGWHKARKQAADIARYIGHSGDGVPSDWYAAATTIEGCIYNLKPSEEPLYG